MKSVEELALPEWIEDLDFRRAVELIDDGDTLGLAVLLGEKRGLINQRVVFRESGYFGNPSLLEFIAENPVRHGVLPANIVNVATTLLEEEPTLDSINRTLALVASGRVPRECNKQKPLLGVLCSYGADPNSAICAAAVHGEFDAIRELIWLGARTDLSVLAALGSTQEFFKELPSADFGQRHLALAFASQYGRTEIVRALLGAGEDPSRFNPSDAHPHSTPLHQAALSGNMGVVELLAEHGAKLDIRDLLWKGTPEDWARREQRTTVAAYLEGSRNRRFGRLGDCE